VGQPRAELVGQGMCMFASFELGDWDATRRHVALGRRLAQRLGAKRFEAQYLEMEGRFLFEMGERSESLRRLREAVRLSHDAGVQFTGPSALGALARATEDASELRALLAEGEALLGKGAVAHNHFWFYRDAIEAMIAHGAWSDALRFAASLEAYTR